MRFTLLELIIALLAATALGMVFAPDWTEDTIAVAYKTTRTVLYELARRLG